MSGWRRVRVAGWIAAALGVGACAGPSPERALEAYGRALERRDVDAVVERSRLSLGATLTLEELARFLAKNPATTARAAAAARSSVRAVELRATVVTESGAEFELVRAEDGAWRVVDGPLPLPRLDTPEHALQTFFFAARGHLELLRQTMPADDRARFASDAELGRHLYASSDRIAAARAALEPLRPGMACVEGDVARIAWGDGRSVVLVREDGGWRVADLE
jgi:hypothetical protein